MPRAPIAAALLALALAAPAQAATTTTVGNGTVDVGLTDLGVLGALPCDANVGVRLTAVGPTGDGVCFGKNAFDGWGAADATSGVAGAVKSPDVEPAMNVTPVSVTAGGSGTTVTAIDKVGSTLRVTHALAPSPATPNVYISTVTIKNISAAPVDLRYRHTTDWDAQPTAFKEHVTLGGTKPPSLTDGGAVDLEALPTDSLNPLAAGRPILNAFPGPVTDAGPADMGARFDLTLGAVPPDQCLTFQLYFGAAADEATAASAVSAAGITTWALFQSDTGFDTGTPVTWITGYSAPASGPVPCPDPVADPPTPATTPPPLSASTVFVLPGTRACVSRRAFRIRLRVPTGVVATSATVLVNGRQVKAVKGTRLTAPIDLRGLPKGRFRVKITLKTADGRTVTSTRRYRTCVPKRRSA